MIVAAALALASCTDKDLTTIDGRLSSDEQALQQLGDRISSVEKTLLQINTDIRSLLLLRGGIIVNSLVGDDASGWVLTLGDGRKVTIPPQGPKGNAPVISMDDEGYWMVDYGNGPFYILDQDGHKVLNSGKGVPGRDADYSPILGVDDDGCWKISYDGGKTWQPLTDPDGKPVPTEIEIGETLFQSVSVVGNSVTFTLKGGETFTLPLVKNFLCAIQGADGVQQFAAGQTRDYTVQSEGVLETFVTCPSGWAAVLNGSTLSVTAASAATKVYFDTEEYVALYAVSADGRSIVSSMKVAISE